MIPITVGKTMMFIPISTGHSTLHASMDISHPIIFIICVVIPIALSGISLALAMLFMPFDDIDLIDFFMKIVVIFLALFILGIIFWTVVEAISSIL